MTHRLHDAAIVGVGIQNGNLVIAVNSTDNSRSQMSFIEPITWNLSPFSTQNIILDFYEYDYESLSGSICEFFEINKNDKALVLNDGYKLYCYTSSVGMEGYIISKELKVEQL